jgi:ATP-dependent 26S proteasome regulatory subunit
LGGGVVICYLFLLLHVFDYKVTHKTKITLVGPPGAKSNSQVEEQSLAVVESENPTGKIVEEVKYTSLGGLERQIEEIKQIVRFSLLRPELLAGYP